MLRRSNQQNVFTSSHLSAGAVARRALNVSLAVLIGYLSVPVVMNLLSSRQVMNTSFDPLRIVNTYGAFGRYAAVSGGRLPSETFQTRKRVSEQNRR